MELFARFNKNEIKRQQEIRRKKPLIQKHQWFYVDKLLRNNNANSGNVKHFHRV